MKGVERSCGERVGLEGGCRDNVGLHGSSDEREEKLWRGSRRREKNRGGWVCVERSGVGERGSVAERISVNGNGGGEGGRVVGIGRWVRGGG